MINFSRLLSYISFLFLCFFLFNIDVDAKLYNTGDCIYNFNKANGSLRINQDVSGNVKYYFSYEKLTSSDAQGWGEVGDIISIDVNNNDSIYDKCPKYAHYHQDEFTGFINFYFSDKEKEEGYQESASVNSSPKLVVPPKSETGEKATCAQTKKIDWLKPVPKVDEVVEGEAHCLYYGENDNGCHIIQIDYRPGDSEVSVSNNFLDWSDFIGSKINSGIKKEDVITRLKVGCSKGLGLDDALYGGSFSPPRVAMFGLGAKATNFQYHFGKGNYLNLNLFKDVSTNVVPVIVKPDALEKYSTCDELLNDDLSKLLKAIVGWIRILIPIMLVCFGVADFGMAIFASDEEKMKKAQGKFIKRLIIGVVIFLIPSFIKMFLTLAQQIWPFVDATLCGIL